MVNGAGCRSGSTTGLRARRAAHALRRNRIGARATSSVDVWPCQPMLALRSHVAEAADASSSLSSRAPPSLGQDRSTPPSGAQSRRRRARGRRATRQGLLLADFSRARRLLACSPLALADAGADHDNADDGADAQQQAQQHQHQHQHQHLHSTPAAAAPCWQQHSQQLQQLKLLQQQQLL